MGTLRKTALYDFHTQGHLAKMVEFAGYLMPVEYKERAGGVLKEHMHTRTDASLFDVSHMGQVQVRGPNQVEFLNRLLVSDLESLPVGGATLSLITNQAGGIIDDTVVTRYEDHL
jgi:aminomethyltransferase